MFEYNSEREIYGSKDMYLLAKYIHIIDNDFTTKSKYQDNTLLYRKEIDDDKKHSAIVSEIFNPLKMERSKLTGDEIKTRNHQDPGDIATQQQAFKDDQYALSEELREIYVEEYSRVIGKDISVKEEQAIYEVISKVAAKVARNVRYLEPIYQGNMVSKVKSISKKTKDKKDKKYRWYQKKLGVTQIVNGREYTLPTKETMPSEWTYDYAKTEKKDALEWITSFSGLRNYLKAGGAADDVLYQDQLGLLDPEGLKALKNYFQRNTKLKHSRLSEVLPACATNSRTI